MKTTWIIDLDRYGDESKSKSLNGETYSLKETADMLIAKLETLTYKPELIVLGCGIGIGLSDYLTAKKIEHKLIKSVVMRLGSADIHKFARDI